MLLQKNIWRRRDGHGLDQSMSWIGLGRVDFLEFFVGWVGWIHIIYNGWAHYSVMLIYTKSKIMQCEHFDVYQVYR